MSKKWYSISVKNTVISPTDAQTVFLRMNTNGASNQSRVLIPRSWTIKSIIVSFLNSWTLSSGETSSIFLNKNWAINETLISNEVVNNARNTTYSSDMQVAVIEWDYINIQWTTPTRATNPTAININAYIWIE